MFFISHFSFFSVISLSFSFFFSYPWCSAGPRASLIATFSNEDENEDEDWYDRLGPGTRTSSTAVFRRETKTFSKPVTVRGRVSSYSESHQGKCLSKNFVTSSYFSTAMKLFPMKSFCYFTIVSSQRIQIIPMKTINGLIWIL